MKNAYSHTQIYFQNELTEIAGTKRKTIHFSERIKNYFRPARVAQLVYCGPVHHKVARGTL